MVVKVYKRTLVFTRLAGWVDGEGNTYKRHWLTGGRLLDWSVDKQGRIYKEFGGLKSLVAWVDSEGNLFDLYLVDYGTSYQHGYSETPYHADKSSRVIFPGIYYDYPNRPGLAAHITAEGKVYKHGHFLTRYVGRIEGTDDLRLMAGLALLLILE